MKLSNVVMIDQKGGVGVGVKILGIWNRQHHKRRRNFVGLHRYNKHPNHPITDSWERII